MRSANSPRTFAPMSMAMMVRKKCSVRIPPSAADDPSRRPMARRPARRPVHCLPLRLRAIDDLLDEEFDGSRPGDFIGLRVGAVLATAAHGGLLVEDLILTNVDDLDGDGDLDLVLHDFDAAGLTGAVVLGGVF